MVTAFSPSVWGRKTVCWTPNPRILKSFLAVAWQSVTGAWQPVLERLVTLSPPLSRALQRSNPSVKVIGSYAVFLSPLGSEQVRSPSPPHLHLLLPSPSLLFRSLALQKDQIIQRQTSQYETSSFQWPNPGPVINITVRKRWIPFKENSPGDSGNITCFLLNSEFYVDSRLGGFSTPQI